MGQDGRTSSQPAVDIIRPDLAAKTPIGERPMSIGRYGPGSLLLQRWQRGRAPLPGIDSPRTTDCSGAESEARHQMFLPPFHHPSFAVSTQNTHSRLCVLLIAVWWMTRELPCSGNFFQEPSCQPDEPDLRNVWRAAATQTTAMKNIPNALESG